MRKPSYLARVSERREPKGAATLAPPRLLFRPTSTLVAAMLESEPGRPAPAAALRTAGREPVDIAPPPAGQPAAPLAPPRPTASARPSRPTAAPAWPLHALDVTSALEPGAARVAPAMTPPRAVGRPAREQTPAAPPPSVPTQSEAPPRRSAAVAEMLFLPRPRAIAPLPGPAGEAAAPAALALAPAEPRPATDARVTRRRRADSDVVAGEMPDRRRDPAPGREAVGDRQRRLLAPPSVIERRGPTRPASPDGAAASKGGVQIGTLEVRIVPPASPPPPAVRPVAPSRQAAALLSRGFRAFGLAQS